MPEEKAAEVFAMVELMGHQKMVGKVTEVNIAGKGFIRIGVLDPTGKVAFTRDVNPDSVYAINPIDKNACILYAQKHAQQPVVPYSISPEVVRELANPAHSSEELEFGEDDGI